MAIRKPSVSVEEAKRLARCRPDADDSQDKPSDEVKLTPRTAPMSVQSAVRSPPVFATAELTQPITKPELQPSHAATLSETKFRDASPAPNPRLVTPSTHVFAGVVFPEAEPTEPKTQVFLSAPLPASGVSVSYDSLSKQYPATKALQMILRRALDGYETRLDDGSYRASAAEYLIGSKDKPAIVQTSRMMPVRLIEIARAHFDPLGFESARAFGRKLACAALACFFETEKKRKR